MPTRPRPLHAPLLVLALACSTDPVGLRHEDIQFSIDRSEYLAVPIQQTARLLLFQFQVVARLDNLSSRPLYLPRCYPESPKPGFAVPLIAPPNPEGSAYNPNWGCVGHDSPIVILPHASRVDTLGLAGPNGFRDGIGLGTLEGTFDLVYSVSDCRPFVISCKAIEVRRRFTVRKRP